MLSGDNSILQKATEAKETSERAEAKEQARIDIMAWITDKTSNHEDASLDDSIVKGILNEKSYVKEAKAASFITAKGEYEIPYSELYQANGSNNNDDNPPEAEYPYRTPYIPTGFSHTGTEDWNHGYTITGKNDTTNAGDEFVWVPCVLEQSKVKSGDIVQTFGIFLAQASTNEEYATDHNMPYWPEAAREMLNNEGSSASAIRTSVEKYGGFYIAKYEASQDDGAAKSISGATVWNRISRENAITVSASMIPTNTGCKSALISGACWDTTLQWIKQTTNSNYDVDSTDKGYYSQDALTYTGYYAINNIYDMAGNIEEWTTENSLSGSNNWPVSRGGGITTTGSYSPAAKRNSSMMDQQSPDRGFRVVLYK